MYDYTGDMEYFQKQLLKKGITKEMFDITNYAGLTFAQLQDLVNNIHFIDENDDVYKSKI